jgi:putative transcriptional regulator
MTNKKKNSRLAEAILETAGDMHRLGLLENARHEKITVRHLSGQSIPAADPISAKEIRKLRQRSRLSQAAFARCLNVTAGYISQLERGTKEPKGAALALLNVVRRKGVEVVL